MLFDNESGDKTSSKRCRATGSHGTSRSPHRRPLGLPRNPMECGISIASNEHLVWGSHGQEAKISNDPTKSYSVSHMTLHQKWGLCTLGPWSRWNEEFLLHRLS